MQTKNHKKEGFTLVELIVVIVVIAILTAILIPTIGYVIEHSKETADITTVKLLNLALVEDNAKNDAPETMTDVIKIMKSKGYLIDKITPRSSGDILWDSANNRFMLKKDDKILYQDKSTVKAEPYELWKVVETEKDGKVIENLQSVLKSDSYSHYLKGENFAQSLTVSTGLDVGENVNIPSVSYNGNTKTQKVTIRTQGGSLSIDAGTDTVNHYGWVKELAVTAVATSDCYHEHGFVGKLVAFSSGRYIAAKGTIFHETKNEIETIIGSNEKELTKAKFGGHYYNANGVCVMEDCTGSDGHRATNDTHVHKYDENGACECGASENTGTTEIRIKGVASWNSLDDHKDDDGNLIGKNGNNSISDYGVTCIGGVGYAGSFYHTMTITYTIPANTSANAKILLEQPTEIMSRMVDLAAPSQAFGITYKIINESGNEYTNINVNLESNLVNSILNSESIIKMQDDKWVCLLKNNTWTELADNARPLITTDGPFEEYRKWLKDAGKTTCGSVNTEFIEEYYKTYSIMEGQRFIDFVKTLPESADDVTVTTQANVYEKMCGNGTGNPAKLNNDYCRHVESAVIKQMIIFQQKHLIGYAFVENKYDATANKTSAVGWRAVYSKIYSSCSVDSWNYSPLVQWENIEPTGLAITSAVDLFNTGTTFVYKKNKNIITGGVAMLWHGFAANAWMDTMICDFPAITITLES